MGICGSVASFTDAWIETGITGVKTRWWGVASFTDAWIETTVHKHTGLLGYVASFTDAWIETCQPFESVGRL